MTPAVLGISNECILLDRAGTHRPERRTALIAGPVWYSDRSSQCDPSTEGQPEVVAGFTFFGIGHTVEERREAGVSPAIRCNLVNKLVVPPKGLIDHLMMLHLPLPGKHFATVGAVPYAG